MAEWEMDQDYLTVRTTETHKGPSPHIRSISGKTPPAALLLNIATPPEW